MKSSLSVAKLFAFVFIAPKTQDTYQVRFKPEPDPKNSVRLTTLVQVKPASNSATIFSYNATIKLVFWYSTVLYLIVSYSYNAVP